MPETVFPYPGGKSHLSEWIESNMPACHECYVEVFGGAAGVLFNKRRSDTEVYNDIDGDLVNFFKVLRDKPDELQEFVDNTPYSRELHEDYCERLYGDDEVPEDPVRRAGEFFVLRHTQWGGKYDTNSGFGYSKKTNDAQAYESSKEALQEFADRMKGVLIENGSYENLIESYDGEETLFYCDPPYVGTETHYRIEGFDHTPFIEAMLDIEGYFIISYADALPEIVDEELVEEHNLYLVDKSSKNFISNGLTGSTNDITERLIMNYDISDYRPFHRGEQSSLGQTLNNEDSPDKPKEDNDDSSGNLFLSDDEGTESEEKENVFLS